MAEVTEAPKEAVKEVKKVEPYAFPFTLGADPEFTVMSGSRPMHAQDIFTTMFKDGEKTSNGFNLPGGNIGWDNHPATGELRPLPGTPEEVTENIKKLFAETHKRMPFVDLTTLTVAASAGGHIHLSVPHAMNGEFAGGGKTPRWNAIERAVGTFLLMIMMGENNLSRELRKKGSNYGQLLDYRIDQKFTYKTGEPGFTLEVRGPTAEWITSEKICLGTLAFMAIAWDSILKGELDPIASIVFRNKTQAIETVTPLMHNFANMRKLYLDKMKPFIRKHPAYPQYKGALELIMNPERVIEEKRRVHYSINEGWGFAMDSKKIPTNAFLDEDKIEEASSKFPEGIIRNLSQFAWNEDYHVEQFATALSKRCIALGWKPQHEYFLFGMKKGIDAIIMKDEAGNFVTGGEIIKTQEDYKLIQGKFKRLGTRAVPVYGRVLNARTGELAEEKDSHRVIIGLPYDMRRKNDVKPLIRLVLRFEKNPKEFSALDSKSLPLGASKLREALEKEEAMEAGINQASERGESLRELPREVVDAAREERAGQDIQAAHESGELSDEASQHVMSRLRTLLVMFRAQYGPGVEQAVALLTNVMGRANGFPGIRRTAARDMVMTVLSRWLVEIAEDGDSDVTQDDVDLIANPFTVAYLLCGGIGQQGFASVAPGENITHRVRATTLMTGNGPVLGLTLQTPSYSTRDGTAKPEVIMDMLGLSSEPHRRAFRELFSSDSSYRQINLDTHQMAPLGGYREEGGAYVINPDARLPHVWSELIH